MGEFDFIICHGVYSWVPDEVQEAILGACGRSLSPTGVAYVGYNTYPGWKSKEIVRDAMLLSVGDSATIRAKVRRARGMVDFLQKVAQPGSVLGQALDDYQQMAAKTGDYYLLHEELELFNAPCYFRDFVARARAHGLDYLSEAQPGTRSRKTMDRRSLVTYSNTRTIRYSSNNTWISSSTDTSARRC